MRKYRIHYDPTREYPEYPWVLSKYNEGVYDTPWLVFANFASEAEARDALQKQVIMDRPPPMYFFDSEGRPV